MYTKYYGFTHKPFELTPDPDVIFMSETHQEAVSILRYGVINRKGFLQLTGNVGTGKSTLLQSLIQSLDSDVHLCYIANPNFTVQEFYYFLGAKFGLEKFDGNKAKFIINLANFLEKSREKKEHVLLIIDESQIMSLELLEEIRLLSNQEMHDVYGVLSIFLVGQPELKNLLDHQKLLPLRNRIAIRFHIDPLSLEETKAYIKFRLRKAGRAAVLFSEKACCEIHRSSKGIPRSINILCDNALLTGFAEERGIIDENIIRDCVGELNQPEKNLLEIEKSQEEAHEKVETAAPEPLAMGAQKQPAFFRPGRVALGVMVIVLFFVSIAATTEYWGKLPGAAPVSAWFEKVNVQVQKVISSLKKNYLTLDAKTDSSSAGIHRFPLKELYPAGLKEENKNAEVSTVSKKKPQVLLR